MTDQVLYRKYRPQTFADVVGQDHVVTVLKNALRQDRVAHAYLFSGPRGTGKTTAARILAKGVNCEKQKDGEPCNTCSTCQEFSRGSAFDLIEIDAASSRGIDEIRELREAVRLAPARARRKAYIIDEVHMLTKEAFNALLKTLEEPPPHAMFILATTELEKVPETIVSRCQHFEFRKIPISLMISRLTRLAKKEGIDAEKDAIRLIAFFADGGLRDAESLLGQVLAGRDALTVGDVRLVLGSPPEELITTFIHALATRNASAALRATSEALDQGTDPQLYLKMVIQYVRHLLLVSFDAAYVSRVAANLTESERIFLDKPPQFSPVELERMLKALIDAYWMSYKTVFPQLPIELAVVEILKDTFTQNTPVSEV